MPSIPLKKILTPLVILGIGIGTASALISSKPDSKPVHIEEKSWLVSTTTVHIETLSPQLSLYGKVESLLNTRLTAPQEVDVVEIKVIEGYTIKKGEILALLDDRDALLLLAQRTAELQEAEARILSEHNRKASDEAALPHEKHLLDLARASVTRNRNLVKKKVASQSTLDDARKEVARQALVVTARKRNLAGHQARVAELEARRLKAEALRDQAQLELNRMWVTAPYDGQVTKVLASIGQRVRKGDGLIHVIGNAGLMLRAQIPSRHIKTTRQALLDKQTLTVHGSIDRQAISATLISLAGEVREGSGGVEGLFQIDNAQGQIQQGRFLRLHLDLPKESNVIALPQEAIYGTGLVYQIKDGRMQSLNVKRIGKILDDAGNTLILIRNEQLKEGDQVVSTQLPNAMNGLLVQIAH